MKACRKSLVFSCAGLLVSLPGWASIGTEQSGYGAKNITMGGASVALPYDALATANNPAGMAKVGDRIDANTRVFRGVAHNSYLDENNKNSINMTEVAPEMGFNHQLGERWTLGMAMYGAGMMANYSAPLLPIPGLKDFKAKLTVISLAPTATYKVLDNLYVGVSPTLYYSVFHPQGLPGIERHRDTATGWGTRIGVLWQVTPQFDLGLAYTPETRMSSFGHYRDNLLRSSDGRYDIVESYGLGAAWRPASDWVIALDYLRYQWGGVDFLNKKSTTGFTDQNVWRAGISYDITDRLTWRMGYSYADDIYDGDYANGHFVGPAISNKSYSFGASYRLNDGFELVGGIERHQPKKLKGTGASSGSTLDVDYGFFVFSISKTFD